jgi:aldose 1-epimerase
MQHQVSIHHHNGIEISVLSNGRISAEIAVNIGNTLYSLKQADDELLYFPFSLETYKASSKLAGNPFMHPWANRLEGAYIQAEGQRYDFPDEHKPLLYRDGNNLPLHGLLLKSDQWKTVERYEEDGLCSHTAAFQFEQPDLLSVFPYRHSIQMKHQLKGNTLTVETTLFNNDEKAMPVSFGFHPYFIRKDVNAALTIPAAHTIETNAVMIPTGNLISKEDRWKFSEDSINLAAVSFDDGFQDLKRNPEGQAVFKYEDINVEFGTGYEYAQIYAPASADKPYVCIEPMTAVTNALNSGTCPVLPSGERFTARFSIVL